MKYLDEYKKPSSFIYVRRYPDRIFWTIAMDLYPNGEGVIAEMSFVFLR